MTQAIETVKLRTVAQPCGRIDRPVAQVALAAAANGVVRFKGIAKRVDPRMATGATRVAGVPLDKLPHGETPGRGLVIRKLGNILGRTRQLISEQDLGHPVAAQDRARA